MFCNPSSAVLYMKVTAAKTLRAWRVRGKGINFGGVQWKWYQPSCTSLIQGIYWTQMIWMISYITDEYILNMGFNQQNQSTVVNKRPAVVNQSIRVSGWLFLLTNFTELEGRVELVTGSQQKHGVVYTRVQGRLRFKSSPEPIGGKREKERNKKGKTKS